MFDMNVQFTFMQQMSVSRQFPAGSPGMTRSLRHIPCVVHAPSTSLIIRTSRPSPTDAFCQTNLPLGLNTYVLLTWITSICVSTRTFEFGDHYEKKREDQIRCVNCD